MCFTLMLAVLHHRAKDEFLIMLTTCTRQVDVELCLKLSCVGKLNNDHNEQCLKVRPSQRGQFTESRVAQ